MVVHQHYEKKNSMIEETNTQKHVPVFNIEDMDKQLQDNILPQTEAISFFDIKELYDRAYAALDKGDNSYKTKEIMAEAIKMDMAYRCQLARKSSYNKPSRLNDFHIITKQG